MKFCALGFILMLFLVADATAAQLTVSWVDNSGGVAGFSLERRASGSSVYSVVASLPVGATSWTDGAVTSGSTYCYRVRAVSSGSTSGYSNEACKAPGTGLSVVKAGTGSGTVVSSPAGINCGTVCSATFSASTVVTLSATASSGSTFAGWSGGGCGGTSSCTLATNVGTTVTASFNKTSTSAPTAPALTLTYNGLQRDRVGAGNTARAADGRLDATLTVRLQGGGRTVTSVKLEGTAPDLWDTESGTGAWLLGVATTLDGSLLNNSSTMAVNFAVADGGTFVIFASQTASFSSGRVVRVTTRFSDGTTATASTTIGTSTGLSISYKGKLRDRVGAGDTARTPDGAFDGVLTATLRAPGGRTITSLSLTSSGGGQWDTTSGTGAWLVGAATSLDGALLNNSTTMAVNFAVADGGTFYLFAGDWLSAQFLSGRTLTLSARFSDGSTLTGSAVVP